MKKRFIALLLAALLVLTMLPATALAATRMTTCALLVSGKGVELSSATGYVYGSGSTQMVPAKTMAAALGLTYEEYKGSAKKVTITAANGTTVRIVSGYRYIQVNGKKKNMRAKAFMQTGSILTVDIKAFESFGYTYKGYAAGSTLKRLGYPGAALAVAKIGESTALPSLGTDSEVAGLDAAQSTNQIVLVKYQSGSKATLSYHVKVDGHWRELLSTTAYVGKNGIGKTAEGDKKTPTGTFNLSKAFGIKSNPGTSMDYVKVNKYMYWCSTSGDPYYNQPIDTRVTNRKRTKADEYILGYGRVYNYCLFVDYNKEGEAGKGSAIFLHCTGSSKYTAGCVAIPEKDMKFILQNMTDGAKIVIK